MERFFYPLVAFSLALLFFEVCAISRALWRLEKTQKRISEDLQMFINFYLTKKK